MLSPAILKGAREVTFTRLYQPEIRQGLGFWVFFSIREQEYLLSLLREEMAVKAGERGLGEQCIEMTYTT
jgi:hypothetical protein